MPSAVYYLVAIIQACTRIVWAEVVSDIKSLSVMFAALKSINFVDAEYRIQFEAIDTDICPEMASPRNMRGPSHGTDAQGTEHQALLPSRPYRPQANGKIERSLENPERGPPGGNNLRVRG